MLIIGITGTLGAGKGTIVDFLTSKKGFAHYSVRNFLKRKLNEQGIETNRDTLTMIANKLREENTPSYVTDQLYKEALQAGNNCIIESIRTPGEIASLRKTGNFVLFAVDADPRIRYDRIFLRGSETDKISYEVFISNEEREMQSSNTNHQNLAACIQLADFVFSNNGSVIDLQQSVEAVINKLIA
jgi:dephospho-CoA kinase